ncbi:MAG TPA: hypothetical protein VJ761_24200 [Ktedonobacteraceae bacterium]|nr:hypothetical protein [Ktedonobacteraceae bacterium]
MTQQSAAPTLYELKGHDLHLTYSTTTITGQAQFEYQGALGAHTLNGNEIRTQESELGTLVSVTLVPTVDATSVTLTILIPSFNLGNQNEQSFKTLAIQATHAGPDTFQVGARESYEVFHVHGTAKLVLS